MKEKEPRERSQELVFNFYVTFHFGSLNALFLFYLIPKNSSLSLFCSRYNYDINKNLIVSLFEIEFDFFFFFYCW